MKNKVREFPVTVNGATEGISVLRIIVVATALVVAFGTVTRAESPGARSSGAGQGHPELRHDAWRYVPQTLLPAPRDPEQIRILNERGKFFDQFSNTRVPLDQPQPPGGRSGYTDPDQPEIPFFENEAIIVGTFESHQVYLTPSHLSIYTDVKVLVEQALKPGPT
jgi:hypothetical protein